MEIINSLLHFDVYLLSIIETFGYYTYLLLFLIIFAETGLVVTPFLPGDSLLFVVGTLAGAGYLNIYVILGTLTLAAILGDSVNYSLGKKLGAKVFSKTNSRFFNPDHLEKTRKFYAKYGAKTIILARFVPIVRTFAPFVAGIGEMHYGQFVTYNILGGIIWVFSLTILGYFFGGLEIIKNNFEIAIFGVIFLSLIPVIYEIIMHKLEAHKARKLATATYEKVQDTFERKHLSEE